FKEYRKVEQVGESIVYIFAIGRYCDRHWFACCLVNKGRFIIMRQNEKELEELVKEVEYKSEEVYNHPPLFELFVTMFSITMAVLLFVFPTMLYEPFPLKLYDSMTWVMPQSMWAFVFLIACIIKAVGLLFGLNKLRIIGLVISAVIYSSIAVFHALDFPSFGTVVFTYMTLFSLISIPTVSYTSIKQRKDNDKRGRFNYGK